MAEINKKVGVLWLKDKKAEAGKPASRYFSGTLNLGLFGDVHIVIFKNTFKKNEKDPDFNIMLSKPKQAERQAGEDDDSDVPF